MLNMYAASSRSQTCSARWATKAVTGDQSPSQYAAWHSFAR